MKKIKKTITVLAILGILLFLAIGFTAKDEASEPIVIKDINSTKILSMSKENALRIEEMGNLYKEIYAIEPKFNNYITFTDKNDYKKIVPMAK